MESRKIVMRTFSFICLFFIVNLFLMNKIKSLQRFMNLDKQKNLLLIIGSMSITYVFSRIVTYKKYKKRKMFSPHRNHDIHYYFSKLCLQHTKWKKKLFHVITHTKNLLWHTKIRIDLLKCLYNTQLQVRSVRSVTSQLRSYIAIHFTFICKTLHQGVFIF